MPPCRRMFLDEYRHLNNIYDYYYVAECNSSRLSVIFYKGLHGIYKRKCELVQLVALLALLDLTAMELFTRIAPIHLCAETSSKVNFDVEIGSHTWSGG